MWKWFTELTEPKQGAILFILGGIMIGLGVQTSTPLLWIPAIFVAVSGAVVVINYLDS